MDALAARTGRPYHLVDYTGHPDAERVIVIMGSGAQTAAETAEYLAARGEQVGVVTVRLFRPFPADGAARRAAADGPPGRRAGPDQGTRLAGRAAVPRRAQRAGRGARGRHRGRSCRSSPAAGTGCPPRSSPPAWWRACFADLAAGQPEAAVHHRHHRRRQRDQPGLRPDLDIEPAGTVRAVFFGLGSDGTVGANKNTIKILGADSGPERPGLLRLRLQEIRLADRLAPPLRAGADPRSLPCLERQFRRMPPG